MLLGWRTVCAVELDAYARGVLLARQRDGHLPQFPIWDDVRTFNGRPWRGHVDLISGGFPCQDISTAGKREGVHGKRSGLWSEMARIVEEVRPPLVLVENSPQLAKRGLGVVLGDLSALGYDARWGVLGARHVSAPHARDRIWIVANTNDEVERGEPLHEEVAEASKPRKAGVGARSWPSCPDLARVDDGMADRMDRIRVTGNGQVSRVVAFAWRILTNV